MLWLRVAIGLAVTAFLAWSIWTVVQQINSASSPISIDAPGVSRADREALAAPIDDLLAGRDADLLAALVSDLDQQQAQVEIDRIQAMAPSGNPTTSRLILWRVTHGTGGQQLSGNFEYGYPEHIVAAQSALARASDRDAWRVSGFYVNIFERSALPPSGVSLEGKPPGFMAIVVATFAVPAFILLTFWVVLLSKRVRRRWLWAIAVLIGLGTFSVNAVTGAISFQPVSFLLFGASAMWSGSLLDSWVLSVAPPLGAIAFWLLHWFTPSPPASKAEPA